MSYKNREIEYKRLKSLGREKDIPQSLRDEFEKAAPAASPIPKESKLKKKGKR